MENYKQDKDDTRLDAGNSSSERDATGAKSVTDLIDSIERTAFKRYLSDRQRALLRWPLASRAEI